MDVQGQGDVRWGFFPQSCNRETDGVRIGIRLTLSRRAHLALNLKGLGLASVRGSVFEFTSVMARMLNFFVVGIASWRDNRSEETAIVPKSHLIVETNSLIPSSLGDRKEHVLWGMKSRGGWGDIILGANGQG